MKFKVVKGSELFDKLTSLKKEMIRCNNAAFNLVKKLGYSRMRGRAGVLAGGISSIEIKSGQPEGWRKAYSNRVSNEYFPAKIKANKDLLDKINALPILEYDALNDLVDFDWRDCDSRFISFNPGVYWQQKVILIDISSEYSKYKPVEGMIEILDSEFQKIKNEADKKKEKSVA